MEQDNGSKVGGAGNVRVERFVRHCYCGEGNGEMYDDPNGDWVRYEDWEAMVDRYRKALERLRDCDWVITLPDRMDAVRQIAREALDA